MPIAVWKAGSTASHSHGPSRCAEGPERPAREGGKGQGRGREGTGQGAGRGGGSGKPRDASICDELLSISEIKPNEARQPRTVNASPVMKARIHRCLVFLRLASGSKNKQRRPKRVIKTGLAVLLHNGGERTWSPPPSPSPTPAQPTRAFTQANNTRDGFSTTPATERPPARRPSISKGTAATTRTPRGARSPRSPPCPAEPLAIKRSPKLQLIL